LVKRRADVMFTDDIEVELQHRLHRELCATMTTTLTQADKAWLLPPQDEFAASADRWLESQVEAGAIKRLLEKSLDEASSSVH
jgi:ABC-type amino acid transport substrate-binding protein